MRQTFLVLGHSCASVQASRGGDLPSIIEYAHLLGQSACTPADLRHHRHTQQQQQQGAPASVIPAEGVTGSAAEWLAGALHVSEGDAVGVCPLAM